MSHFVSMKAKKAFTYGTRRLAVDETFEAHRKDARVLEAIGKASPADQQAAMTPEKTPSAPSPKPKAPTKPKPPKKPKAPEKIGNGYKRRDVKPSETK